MTTYLRFKATLLALLTVAAVSTSAVAAENIPDTIEILRSTYQADRQAFLAETLGLTESESVSFWPLYRSYRADMDQLGDGLVKLVLEYSDLYPDVPEERARRMLKEYSALEQKLASTRAWYLKRAAKFLSASKTLRWAQLENRLDLAMRLQLAGAVPLMPTTPSQP